MKVSIDFDGTITKSAVYDYAKELIARDIDVWICTARYEDGTKNAFWGNTSNNDLYNVAKELGIPLSNIIFTNMEDKSSYLDKLKPAWHLDDDFSVLEEIRDNSSIMCVNVHNYDWQYYCELYLKLAEDV